MKGLVIAEPWIGRILAGRKTWEMRNRSTYQRGTIALIRRGSGQVVGAADVIETLSPLETHEAYAAGEPYHAIAPQEQAAAFDGGWRTPWVLANVRQLAKPVSYKHPNGAVIWVNLDNAVAATVWEQLNCTQKTIVASDPNRDEDRRSPAVVVLVGTNAGPAAVAPAERAEPLELTATRHNKIDGRIVKLTGGNVRNHHIYLPLDFFPDDAIGGPNGHDAARRLITVTFHPGQTIDVDVDGTKRILRARGAVRDFFERADMREGDGVLIERNAPYRYSFSKAKR